MVSKKKVREFLRKGGYDILRETAKDPKDLRTGNISEAHRVTAISRPVIRGILKQYPTKKSVTRPELKYVAEFTDTKTHEGYRLWKTKIKPKLTKSRYNMMTGHLLKAWKLLGQTDMAGWGEKQFAQIWSKEIKGKPNPFWTTEGLVGGREGISEHIATTFHHLLDAIGRAELKTVYRGIKYEKGKKKLHFLHTSNIKKAVDHTASIDLLMYQLKALLTGGRHSCIELTQPKDFNFKDNEVMETEPKIGKTFIRYLDPHGSSLLKRYIGDFHFKRDDYIFRPDLSRGRGGSFYTYINEELKKIGEAIGLKFAYTTHILKHTFVTQSARHGISGDSIVLQVNTEWRTLDSYYKAENPQRLKHEYFGAEKTVKLTMHTWLKEICEIFGARYDYLVGVNHIPAGRGQERKVGEVSTSP